MKETKIQESVITSEKQYVNTLSDIAKTGGVTNYSLITDASKEALESKEAEINEFIKVTKFTDENKDYIRFYLEKAREFKDVIRKRLGNKNYMNEYDVVKNIKNLVPCPFYPSLVKREYKDGSYSLYQIYEFRYLQYKMGHTNLILNKISKAT